MNKKPNHRFYAKTKREQYRFQALIVLGAFLILLLSFYASYSTRFYLIGFLTFSILLSIIAPFLDTPSMKKSGKLIYHSLLFVSEKPANGVIKIHGGTLFDYVFVLDKKMNGKQRTSFILQQYLQGLLNLIEEYEDQNTGGLKIRGTSYILNKKTVERIGFQVIPTDTVQNLILIYNYFNVLLSYSIAKNKLSFPPLKQTKTFEAPLDELIKHKACIAALNEKIKTYH